MHQLVDKSQLGEASVARTGAPRPTIGKGLRRVQHGVADLYPVECRDHFAEHSGAAVVVSELQCTGRSRLGRVQDAGLQTSICIPETQHPTGRGEGCAEFAKLAARCHSGHRRCRKQLPRCTVGRGARWPNPDSDGHFGGSNAVDQLVDLTRRYDRAARVHLQDERLRAGGFCTVDGVSDFTRQNTVEVAAHLENIDRRRQWHGRGGGFCGLPETEDGRDHSYGKDEFCHDD